MVYNDILLGPAGIIQLMMEILHDPIIYLLPYFNALRPRVWDLGAKVWILGLRNQEP